VLGVCLVHAWYSLCCVVLCFVVLCCTVLGMPCIVTHCVEYVLCFDALCKVCLVLCWHRVAISVSFISLVGLWGGGNLMEK